MSHLYEGMFIVDNDVVRAGWSGAKAVVVDVLKKHGASVVTARRWDERKLAYSVRHKSRGTYLLSFFELGTGSGDALRRDLDLDERVLRYLILRSEGLPEGEQELASAEDAADFTVPEPPPDVEPQAPEPPPRRREEREARAAAEAPTEEAGEGEAEGAEPTPEPALAEAKEKE